MPKLVPVAALALLSVQLAAGPARASILGPHAAQCEQAGHSAMLVRVTGLKSRTGIIRVQSYGGDPSTYFEKGQYLERVEVTPPANGPVDV